MKVVFERSAIVILDMKYKKLTARVSLKNLLKHFIWKQCNLFFDKVSSEENKL